MKKRSESKDADPSLRDKIIGLGERSIRKSYYPQLQLQLEDVEVVRKELAESRARYRSLVENINDVIFSLDAEGVVTYISPVIQSLNGFMPEEIIGNSFKEFIHPDDLPTLATSFERVLAGELSPSEYRVRVKGDGFRHVHSSSRPLLEEGRVVGLAGVMSDITEREEAEKQRQGHLHFMESMDQINRAIQGTDDLNEMMGNVLDEVLAIFECDRGALVYPCDPESTTWTARMERTRPEYPGILSLGIEVPMEAEAIAVFRAVLDTDSPVRFGPESSYPLPAQVAERFGIRSQIAMAIHLKGDKPWMFVLHQCSHPRVWTYEEVRLLQEIGRRIADGLTSMLIMRELQESEEKFSRAFYASPNLMAITTPEDGRIIEINEAFCRFFGYEREECIGHNTAELDMWADPEQREVAIKKLKEIGAALYMPVDLRTKSGEIRSTIDSMVFITLGNQKCLLSVAVDITERKQAEERLRGSLVETIRAIAITVEKRDPYTAGHQNRVTKLCVAIGTELGLDTDRLEGLRLGAMIFDIGKVYVPAEILNRPGKLTELEFEMVKEHSQVGYEIVKDVKFPWPVAEMILQHHERLDGSGYPNGLKAPEILMESRIIAVADVVEAMLSHRPYRGAQNIEETMQEIELHRGTKYDSEVVDACLHLFRERGFSFI